MSTLRVKLMVLPYEERLCILTNSNSTISDLKAKVFHAIQFYSIYKDYLSFCTIHLELKINDALYAIPPHYVLKDCVEPNDVFIVSFIENKDFENRQSIHMKYQTKSDIDHRRINTMDNNNKNNKNNNNMNGGVAASPDFNRYHLSPPPNQPNQPNQRNQGNPGNHPNGAPKSYPIASNPEYQTFIIPNTENKNDNDDNNNNLIDSGNLNINEIQQWIARYLINNGTLYASRNIDYKTFATALYQRFPNSIQNLLRLNAMDIQTFIVQQCQLEIVRSVNGWNVQWIAPQKEEKKEMEKKDINKNINKSAKKNKHKNKNKNKQQHQHQQQQHQQQQKQQQQHQQQQKQQQQKEEEAQHRSLHPSLQDIAQNAPNTPIKQIISAPIQSPMVTFNQNNNKNNKKNDESVKKKENKKDDGSFNISAIKDALNNKNKRNKKNKEKKSRVPQHDLPTTPDSPTDDENDENDENDHDENKEDIISSHRMSPPPAQQIVIEEEEVIQDIMCEEDEEEEVEEEEVEVIDDKQDTVKAVTELLPEILLKCYNKLSFNNNNNTSPLYKYVILTDLEREIKNTFRDTTPYQFNIYELDYVNFKQLLLMGFKSMNIDIVECEKKLMSLKRGESYNDDNNEKIIKRGREYEPCSEIESYVVIKTDDEKKDDNDNDNDNDDDLEIIECIKYLSAANTVKRLTSNDVYYHIKLMHSECDIGLIETEINGHGNGMGFHHGIPHSNYNSFDEIASELRENNINGSRILEMKWSDWEMLHDLNRYDRDHQDFVEDIIMDFFFPFITGQELSNLIASSSKFGKNQTIFNDETIRCKFTLCIDYGLFDRNKPILHLFIKRVELTDCQRLLKLHKYLSVDVVVGQYSSMHIAAWRGKFKLLATLTKYGGDPLIKNKQSETAFDSGRKHQGKLKWYYSQFPQYKPQ